MASSVNAFALASQSADASERFPDALILADDEARVTYLNPAAEALLGISLGSARGHPLDKVLILQDGETQRTVHVLDPAGLQKPFSGAFQLLVRSGGGGLIPVQFSVAMHPSESGTTSRFVILMRNASGLQLYIDKLVRQTMHDEQTRLLRRAELVKRLWRVLQEPGSGLPQAFLYLDLDNFKAINDTAGHAAGDLAIRQIAARLKNLVRGRDTLARLGGDEFGLLLENCPADRARQRAEQLHEAVESYALRWNGESFPLGVSIGLVLFKTHHHSLNSILSAADAACYRAKREAGKGPHIHEIELD